MIIVVSLAEPCLRESQGHKSSSASLSSESSLLLHSVQIMHCCCCWLVTYMLIPLGRVSIICSNEWRLNIRLTQDVFSLLCSHRSWPRWSTKAWNQGKHNDPRELWYMCRILSCLHAFTIHHCIVPDTRTHNLIPKVETNPAAGPSYATNPNGSNMKRGQTKVESCVMQW